MTQPESALSRKIQQVIRKKGVWCYKVWGNELTPAGIPDIVGVYKGQFVAIETKMPTGRLSTMQKYRIARIRAHGGMVVVARQISDALQMIYHLDHYHIEKCLVPGSPCPYLTDVNDER